MSERKRSDVGPAGGFSTGFHPSPKASPVSLGAALADGLPGLPTDPSGGIFWALPGDAIPPFRGTLAGGFATYPLI